MGVLIKVPVKGLVPITDLYTCKRCGRLTNKTVEGQEDGKLYFLCGWCLRAIRKAK